jgi:branched-chain amino acid transport system substrate-binding protein
MGYVFVSYSRTDSAYVARLVAALREADIDVWVDDVLVSGDRWERVIRDKVDGCSALLAVMTPAADESEWVAREVSRAQVKGKPIVPLLLAGEAFFRLSDMHYDDVTDGRLPGPDVLDRLRRAGATPPPSGPGAGVRPTAVPGAGSSSPGRGRRSLVLASGLAVLLILAIVAAVLRPWEGNEPAPGPTAAGPTTLGPITATVEIGVDLPFRGGLGGYSEEAWNAMQAYLHSVDDRAGAYGVTLKRYENSTPEGGLDQAACLANAEAHVANAKEVAVVGTHTDTCSQIEVPVLNDGPGGPMLLVTGWEGHPRLTRAWDTGEPQKYYPSGERNYARVIPNREDEGAAGARLAKQHGGTTCLVLQESLTYGQRLSASFAAAAAKEGLAVLPTVRWSPSAASYTDLFEAAEASGADCVYIAGNFESNGDQLVRDKVAVLGDNEQVPLVLSSAWTGYDEFAEMPEAEGALATFIGLPDTGFDSFPAALALNTAYANEHGGVPSSWRTYYGVQALQVVLAALERSDGTRASVRDQVFSGDGVTVPAATAILGRDCHIDPSTGDVTLLDFTIYTFEGGKQVEQGALSLG